MGYTVVPMGTPSIDCFFFKTYGRITYESEIKNEAILGKYMYKGPYAPRGWNGGSKMNLVHMFV